MAWLPVSVVAPILPPNSVHTAHLPALGMAEFDDDAATTTGDGGPTPTMIQVAYWTDAP